MRKEPPENSPPGSRIYLQDVDITTRITDVTQAAIGTATPGCGPDACGITPPCDSDHLRVEFALKQSYQRSQRCFCEISTPRKKVGVIVTTRVFRVLFLCAVFSFTLSSAYGQSVWNGGTGNWSDAASWSTGIVPNSSIIDVRIDNGNPAASLVTFNLPSGSVGTLILDSDDTLVINGALTSYYATLTSGTINVNSPGSLNNNGLLNNYGMIQNNGVINNSGTFNNQNTISSDSGSYGYPGVVNNSGVFNNSGSFQDQVINNTGSVNFTPVGTIWNNRDTLNNYSGGTINAESGTKWEGTIINYSGGTINGPIAGAGFFDNRGTINGEIDWQLALDNSGVINGSLYGSGSVTNTGLITGYIDPGSLDNQPGGVIVGSIDCEFNCFFNNSGAMYLSSAYFDIASHSDNSGIVSLDVGGTLTSYGRFTNEPDGTINNNGIMKLYFDVAFVSFFYNYGTLNNNGTLDNQGTLTDYVTENFYNYGTINNRGTLINGPTGNQGTISTIRNYGTINNSGILNNLATSTIINSGAFSISPSGILNNAGTYIQSAGSTVVDGLFSSSTTIQINGGTLSGSGMIQGDVSMGGTLSPGDSPGRLTIQGKYTQLASGTFFAELAGLTPGTEYDQLVLSGTGLARRHAGRGVFERLRRGTGRQLCADDVLERDWAVCHARPAQVVHRGDVAAFV